MLRGGMPGSLPVFVVVHRIVASSRPNEFKIDFVHSMWLLIGCRILIGHSSGVGIRFICVELNAILITGSFWAGYCCAFRISSADNLEEIAFAHK